MAIRVLFYTDGLGKPLFKVYLSRDLELGEWALRMREWRMYQAEKTARSPQWLCTWCTRTVRRPGYSESEGRGGRRRERENKGPESVVRCRSLRSVGSSSETQNHQTFPSQRSNVTHSGCCVENTAMWIPYQFTHFHFKHEHVCVQLV